MHIYIKHKDCGFKCMTIANDTNTNNMACGKKLNHTIQKETKEKKISYDHLTWSHYIQYLKISVLYPEYVQKNIIEN